jgi:uncharacterized protein YeaO (DUF488 family)
MAVKLNTYQCGSLRKKGEGLRVGAVRYLPRGVRKKDYTNLNYFDVWFPTVAPSKEIISEFKSKEGNQKNWDKFIKQYIKEMDKPENKRAIILLAEVATRTPISIGCYCEDEKSYHRSVLRKLIEEAAKV